MRLFNTNAFIFLIVFLVSFTSCDNDNREAQLQLSKVRELYNNKDYVTAKSELDSLNIKFPKALEERKAGIALLDSIRRAENMQTIEVSDSLINVFQPQVNEKKKMFSFQRDKNYQETGSYVPKEMVSTHITGTTLRSGVEENGQLYLESVYIGGQRHNKIRISLKDGLFAESLPVTDDGLNYRFTNMGKAYEIIRFTGAAENNVAAFVFSNAEKMLTVTVDGQAKYSYTLTLQARTAIAKSYELSRMMLQLDSLKTAKEKAEYHLYYLDNKDNKSMENATE